jgi:hypothetical protein
MRNTFRPRQVQRDPRQLHNAEQLPRTVIFQRWFSSQWPVLTLCRASTVLSGQIPAALIDLDLPFRFCKIQLYVVLKYLMRKLARLPLEGVSTLRARVRALRDLLYLLVLLPVLNFDLDFFLTWKYRSWIKCAVPSWFHTGDSKPLVGSRTLQKFVQTIEAY